MGFRWQGWHVALLVVVACVTIAGGLVWNRSRTVPPLAERMHRLPAASTSVFYIDLAQLRSAGILDLVTGQRVSEDADYSKFVASTGFDYRNDLDSALIARMGEGSYILATGRFDWKLIKEHTLRNGGVCHNGLCRMPASTPKRFISYVPLHNTMLAMGVSTDEWAVTQLQVKDVNKTLPVPNAPMWAAVSGPALAQTEDSLPAGTRLFAKALSDSSLVQFGLHPQPSGLEARLTAESRTERAATELENQLNGVTEVFRKYLENVQQKPNPGDLSSILTSGKFTRQSTTVNGTWAIQRSFVEALLGGRL